MLEPDQFHFSELADIKKTNPDIHTVRQSGDSPPWDLTLINRHRFQLSHNLSLLLCIIPATLWARRSSHGDKMVVCCLHFTAVKQIKEDLCETVA